MTWLELRVASVVGAVSVRFRGVNVHKFAEGFGIEILAPSVAKEPRPANVIYGGRVLARLLHRHGPDHAGQVLRCILASDPTCLQGDVIWAVSRFIGAHGATIGQREVVDRFRAIDLAGLREKSRRAAMGGGAPMARRPAGLGPRIDVDA